MAGIWFRSFGEADLSNGTQLTQRIASLSAGTISRIEGGINANGWATATTEAELQAFTYNWLAWGICSTVGDGTETVPDPVANAYPDQDPPTNRWLYWAAYGWQQVDESGTSSTFPFRYAGDGPFASKGQVATPGGLASGEYLNLWMSWHLYSPWDLTGSGDVMQAVFWASIFCENGVYGASL